MALDTCQRGLVQISLMITVGLSGFLRPSEMFDLQGGDIQAPALGITTHDSLLLFPEERPPRSKVGTSDISLLLHSSWLKRTEPTLAILYRRQHPKKEEAKQHHPNEGGEGEAAPPKRKRRSSTDTKDPHYLNVP